jgi:hypothetical protein
MSDLRQTVRPLLAALIAALAIAGAPTRSTRSTRRTRAAPEIMLVYGAPLAERRVIADQAENLRLLLAVVDRTATPPIPPARPALQLALFWGAEWRDAARSPARLRALRPEQATQHGVFYPATATAPAMLALDATIGTVSDSGLAVLRRHGVPTRLPER